MKKRKQSSADTKKLRFWNRAPELDRINAEAWRHFWTGSIEWFKPGKMRSLEDNPIL